MEQRFKLGKLEVIADLGLLSNDNIAALEANGYEYILGSRLRNEPGRIKPKYSTPISVIGVPPE